LIAFAIVSMPLSNAVLTYFRSAIPGTTSRRPCILAASITFAVIATDCSSGRRWHNCSAIVLCPIPPATAVPALRFYAVTPPLRRQSQWTLLSVEFSVFLCLAIAELCYRPVDFIVVSLHQSTVSGSGFARLLNVNYAGFFRAFDTGGETLLNRRIVQPGLIRIKRTSV
jgi:hypothetical protein